MPGTVSLREGATVNGYTFVKRVSHPAPSTHDRHESYIVKSDTSGTTYFARVYPLVLLESDNRMREGVERHVAVARHVSHPNLLRVEDVFSTDMDLYVVEEYCGGGELFDRVLEMSSVIGESVTLDRGGEDVRRIVRQFSQLMKALRSLHEDLGICHRDVKLENIFLDEDGGVKLGGFSLSAVLPQPVKGRGGGADTKKNGAPDRLLRVYCGSVHYAAPEIVQRTPYDGVAADMWSAGVILFALLTRVLPFDSAWMTDEERFTSAAGDSSGGDETHAILAAICNAEMHLLQHPLMRHLHSHVPRGYDLVQRLLRVDPLARIGHADVESHPFFKPV